MFCCHSKCYNQSLTDCPNFDQHETPPQLLIGRGHKVIPELKARFLSSYIRPDQLRLFVICDIANMETAKEIVQPLAPELLVL